MHRRWRRVALEGAFWAVALGAFVTAGALLPGRAVAHEPNKAAGKAPWAVKDVKDVTYSSAPGHDPVKHKLDLYLPDGLKDYPVVLFVHGGAWVRGDKNYLGVYRALGRSLARRGVGVAVTNYRLSPKVKHPEHVKDVARA